MRYLTMICILLSVAFIPTVSTSQDCTDYSLYNPDAESVRLLGPADTILMTEDLCFTHNTTGSSQVLSRSQGGFTPMALIGESAPVVDWVYANSFLYKLEADRLVVISVVNPYNPQTIHTRQSMWGWEQASDITFRMINRHSPGSDQTGSQSRSRRHRNLLAQHCTHRQLERVLGAGQADAGVLGNEHSQVRIGTEVPGDQQWIGFQVEHEPNPAGNQVKVWREVVGNGEFDPFIGAADTDHPDIISEANGPMILGV